MSHCNPVRLRSQARTHNGTSWPRAHALRTAALNKKALPLRTCHPERLDVPRQRSASARDLLCASPLENARRK